MLKTLYIIGIILVSGCASLEQQKWDKFAKEQNCKIIAHTVASSTTGAQFAMVGTHIVVIPSIQHIPAKTEYLCNDGIKYTR